VLPIRASNVSAVCRGLRKLKPILANAEGRPWRAPDAVIAAVREAEARGDFDEILTQGDTVRLAQGVLAGVKAVLTGTTAGNKIEVLMPLFGGVKATARRKRASRGSEIASRFGTPFGR
jgi:hypothetical protein